MGGIDLVLLLKYKELLIYILPVIITFLLSYFLVRWWINIGRKLGYLSKDMNKYGYPKNVVDYGGIFVIISLILGIYVYVLIKNYITGSQTNLLEISIISSVVLLSGFIGALDDFLGWKKGIHPVYRILFTFVFAIPLVVFKLGYSKMELPLIGVVDFGLFYPLLLVPIGIMGASNALNIIAGYNGLEAIMAMLLFLGIAIKSWLIGKYFITMISLITISALLGFYMFNKYPAKVFPGNAMPYALGALFASLVIIGNMEKFGLSIFILYFIELFLFIRGLLNRVYKENFGIPDENNCLKEPYDKSYSITHISIKIAKKLFGCAREKDVVNIIAITQLLIIIIALKFM